MNPETYMSASEEGWAELEAWGLGYPAVSALSQGMGLPCPDDQCYKRPDPVLTLFPSSHPEWRLLSEPVASQVRASSLLAEALILKSCTASMTSFSKSPLPLALMATCTRPSYL